MSQFNPGSVTPSPPKEQTMTVAHKPDERLVLTAEEVAELLCISRAHVFRLQRGGKLPAPVRFGRSVRWARAELEAWLRAGAPSREEWDARQGNGSREAAP
jgi:excisionase family DNA binding protein